MTADFAEYDIESFHTFVQYLIARGPEVAAGGHFGVRGTISQNIFKSSMRVSGAYVP